MEFIVFLLVIFTIVNSIFIFNLRKENKELKRQYLICYQTIEFLKKKLREISGEAPVIPPQVQIKTENMEPAVMQMSKSHPIPGKRKIKEKSDKNFENMFGKNILGFIAAGLIFIGIIAFGALIFTKITDMLKVFLLFFTSFAITGLGVFLHSRNKNAFTVSLTGCGIGSIFVSIFVTHLYFGMINDIMAFAMILLWGIATFFTSRKIDSKALVYIAHLGLIISTFLAIGYGQVDDKLIEIAVYQVLTIALLLIMDYRESKGLFKTASYISLIMNLILAIYCADILDVSHFDSFVKPSVLPVAIMIIFAIVNTAIHIISSRENVKYPLVENILSNILYFANMIGTQSCIYLYSKNIYLFNHPEYTYTGKNNYFNTDYSNLIYHGEVNGFTTAHWTIIMFIVAMLALFIWINREGLASRITILSSMGYTAVSGIMYAGVLSENNSFMIPGLLLLVAVSTFLYYKTDELVYMISSLILLMVESIVIIPMLGEHYGFLLMYASILLAATFVLGFVHSRDWLKFGLATYIMLNTSYLFSIMNFADYITEDETIGWVILTILNIIFKLAYDKYSTKDTLQKVSKVFMGIGETILLAVNSFVIALSASDGWLSMDGYYSSTVLLAFVTFFLGMSKIKDVIENDNKFIGLWYGLKFTWLTLYPMGMLTDFLDEQFVFSIMLMLVALACILFGFKFDVKSTRIYGLIVILASVLKIVILDMWGQDSIIRVVSLIIGGIICFAISAVYNHLEKKIE